MTDTSSLIITHSTPQLLPVTAHSLASPTLNGSLSPSVPLEDDEPYTIKCICAFADDDGNTVFCERCETWQHIECYYHGKKVPEVHNCAECEPRAVDGKRATERQKKLREQNDSGDRKQKRPSSKNHKKKIKDTPPATDQTNGWHDRQEPSNGRDHPPPAKRPKTNHRSSHSIASTNGTPTFHPESRKRATSSAQSHPSPTKSNNHYPPMPMYTQEFLHLYDHDKGKDNLGLQNNFNTINIAGKLKAWLSDPLMLSQDTNGRSRYEIFTPLESNSALDSAKLPRVSRQVKVQRDVEYDGRYPTWHCMVLESQVRKDEIVGEIKGSVGHLEEYCLDGANRWHELRHPEPFVFFHPQLPIYIDSRREGTLFRYLRRSCRPNVTLKTYVTSDDEYHFCFVAKEDIVPGTELTTSWYLDQNIIKNGIVKEELPSEGETDPPWLWVSRILANFGDCACDCTQPCPFAKLDQRRTPRPLDGKHVNGRKRTKKTKHAASPLGNGSTSRAGSEHLKAQDDEDADNCSTSGSARSKLQSRDVTPTNGVIDNANVMIGLSDREKRKIAMAERNFERLEQDQHVQKKKKRTSGGSTLNTPSLVTSVRFLSLDAQRKANAVCQKQLGHSPNSVPPTPNVSKAEYVDSGTSRYVSGSPTSEAFSVRNFQRILSRPVPSAAFHPPSTYVDSAVQTEPDVVDTTMTLINDMSPKRKKFTPLAQKLLKRCYEDRLKNDAVSAVTQGQASPSEAPPSPAPSQNINSIDQVDRRGQDIEMKDVNGDSISHSGSYSPTADERNAITRHPSSTTVAFQTPLLPSQAAHTSISLHKPSFDQLNDSRLSLNTVPPVPSFSSTVAITAAASIQPVSTPVAQSPLSLNTSNLQSASFPGLGGQSPLVAPSPVKKKLSLGDYTSRKRASMTTPSTEKPATTIAPAPPPPTPIEGTTEVNTTSVLALSTLGLPMDATSGALVTVPANGESRRDNSDHVAAAEESTAIVDTPAPGPEPPPALLPSHVALAPVEDVIMTDGQKAGTDLDSIAKLTTNHLLDHVDVLKDPRLR